MDNGNSVIANLSGNLRTSRVAKLTNRKKASSSNFRKISLIFNYYLRQIWVKFCFRNLHAKALTFAEIDRKKWLGTRFACECGCGFRHSRSLLSFFLAYKRHKVIYIFSSDTVAAVQHCRQHAADMVFYSHLGIHQYSFNFTSNS
jgi:hypothetical protein